MSDPRISDEITPETAETVAKYLDRWFLMKGDIGHKTAAEVLRALSAELQLLRQRQSLEWQEALDARRYRWLRELRENEDLQVIHWGPTPSLEQALEDDDAERSGAPLYYEGLDEAVDAAMASP